MIRPTISAMSIHYKCRSHLYPRSNVERFPVPDDKVPWSAEFIEYNPTNYTSPSIEGKPWADQEIGKNLYFSKVQRTSAILTCEMQVLIINVPTLL